MTEAGLAQMLKTETFVKKLRMLAEKYELQDQHGSASTASGSSVRRCAFKGRRECAAVSIVEHRSPPAHLTVKRVPAVQLLLSPHMESGSDFHCFRACTPHLQRVCKEFGTCLNDSSCKIADAIGPFSTHDTYNMHPSMFVSSIAGAQVIDLGKRVVNARASLPSEPGSVHGGENAFAEIVIDSLFKPCG